MFDVALVLGSEKITHPNKALSLGAYASCMDVDNFESHLKNDERSRNQAFKIDIPPGQTPRVKAAVFSWMRMPWEQSGI